MRFIAPHVLAVLLCLGQLAACSSNHLSDDLAHAELARTADLKCTPLALEVISLAARGFGSGVLVHPRIILTAAHIVPIGANLVLAFVDPDGSRETRRIIRVHPDNISSAAAGPPTQPLRDWSMPGGQDDDWALLILESPFTTLNAVPASAMLEAFPPRDAVVITSGFPLGEGGADNAPWSERTSMRVATTIIPRLEHGPTSEELFIGRGTSETPEHSGASGGPVFLASDGAPPALAGIYIGETRRYFLGVDVGHEMVFRRLPIEAIRRAMESLNAD